MKRFLALIAVLVVMGLGASQAWDAYDHQVNAATSGAAGPVAFHVDSGEEPGTIGDALLARGLIRSRTVWDLYLRLARARGTLQAGDYQLSHAMSMAQIVAALQHGIVAQVTVTLPEGYTQALMARAAEAAGLGTAADYAAAAADPAWPYDFLRGRPAGAGLEGFLFPDTYSLNQGASARDLVKRQLDQFDRSFTADLRDQATAAARANGLPGDPVFSTLILASMVEREVNSDPDRAIVCGIMENRLRQHIPLGIDATVLYALGKWKATLTYQDLQVDSPYNTRRFAGLPPGPISNPGLAAIRACVNPQRTDYLFYFTDPKGMTHYARSQAESTQQQKQFGIAFQ